MMLVHFHLLRKAAPNMRKPSYRFFLSLNLRRLRIILGVAGLCLATTLAWPRFCGNRLEPELRSHPRTGMV